MSASGNQTIGGTRSVVVFALLRWLRTSLWEGQTGLSADGSGGDAGKADGGRRGGVWAVLTDLGSPAHLSSRTRLCPKRRGERLPRTCLANHLLPFLSVHLASGELRVCGHLVTGHVPPCPSCPPSRFPWATLGIPGSISRCPLGMATWARPGLARAQAPPAPLPHSAVCVVGRGTAVITVQCLVTSPQRLL